MSAIARSSPLAFLNRFLGRLAVAVWACQALTPAMAAEAPPVRLGVLAFRPLEQTRLQWSPTAAFLESQIPERRFQIVPLTLDTLEPAVAGRQVEFVLANPEQYVLLANRHRLAAIATLMPEVGGRPTSRFGGVIFTRAEREDISLLSDLPGKTIAAVSDKSFAGFLIQRWTLQQAGVDVLRDAAALSFTGLPQDKVVAEVLAGRADAGFVRTGVLEAMTREGKLQDGQLRVINRQPARLHPQALSTSLYPEWPLAVQPDVPEPLVKAVTLALYRLAPDSAAARAGNYYGFAPPGDYTSVEALLHRLHVHPDRLEYFGLPDIGRKYAQGLLLGGALAFLVVFLAALYMRRQNQALKAALANAERLALRDDLLTSLSEGVFGIDANGLCTFINPAALNILGFRRDEVVGHDQHLLFHHHYPDGRPYPPAECTQRQTLNDGQPRQSEEVFFRKDGRAVPVQVGVQPIWAAGRVVGAVVAFSDISERLATENRIRALALHDALTGLPNRRLLNDRLEIALAHAAREEFQVAVLFVDLDEFKPINDRHGHDAGDAVLVEVARRLEDSVRAVDTVARLAGDEFVLVLADLQGPEDAESVTAKLIARLAAPIIVDGIAHRVTASIGIALFPQHGKSPEDLLRAADAAMYAAKHAGKNRAQFAAERPEVC